MKLSDKNYVALFQVRCQQGDTPGTNISYILLLDSHTYCITTA